MVKKVTAPKQNKTNIQNEKNKRSVTNVTNTFIRKDEKFISSSQNNINK